jgi:hypothetical protein
MSDDSVPARLSGDRFLEKSLIVSGFVFCLASAGTLLYGVYLLFTTGGARRAFTDLKEVTAAGLIALNADLIIITVFAVILAWLGLGFFRKAGQSTNYVIRPEDREGLWPLIQEPKPEAIDQYIRLASLSGISGAFTKVGFTGLPLATVVLTLLFVFLSLGSGNKELMELAKLTLGAFIGSFVQRQVERGQGANAPAGPGGSGNMRTRSTPPEQLPV